MSKKCFVISPIGKEGSDIRLHADDFFDLVVQPALEPFGFEVIRADKINKPSVITNDIIELVQLSDLCIVDLTFSNPNVFYECGRRHEVGKPTIQLIKKGESIPFDLGGIRTIEYDLSTPRSVKEAIEIVRKFTNEFVSDEFQLRTNGTSLATLASAISRIEKKLSTLNSTTSSTEGAFADGSWDKLKTILQGPNAIAGMIASGNFDGAADLLLKSRNRFGKDKFRELSILLSMSGSERGRDLILDMVNDEILRAEANPTHQDIVMLVGSIVQYYSLRDEEALGLEELGSMFATLLERYKNDNDNLGFLHGQLAKLCLGSGDHEKAFTHLKKAQELCPDVDAYRRQYQKLAEHMGKEI